MRTTQQLSITLPNDMAEAVKSKVAAGEYASWIAAPKMGVDGKPGDFQYVQIHA